MSVLALSNREYIHPGAGLLLGLDRQLPLHDLVQQLPESLDLCVLSTASDIRLKLLDELVDHTQVEYVIFEKVHFFI